MLSPFFPSLKSRITDPELMDDLACDKQRLIKTVKQFKLTNYFLSRSRGLIKHFILKDMHLHGKSHYTLLDIGAGGGDIDRWLVRACRRRKFKLTLTCLDNDETIVAYTKEICREYPEINVVHGSVFDMVRLGKFDYIFSNHFLHHFSDDDLVKIFNLIFEQTDRLFLMNDLCRSIFAYWGFYLFSKVFLHHSFAAFDGLLSIRKGFLQQELRQIIDCTRYPQNAAAKRFSPGRAVIVGQGR